MEEEYARGKIIMIWGAIVLAITVITLLTSGRSTENTYNEHLYKEPSVTDFYPDDTFTVVEPVKKMDPFDMGAGDGQTH
tara:strand:- start:1018 stop:1254 length:237 start_codon:yes stop_codon:yes gene_type:complete